VDRCKHCQSETSLDVWVLRPTFKSDGIQDVAGRVHGTMAYRAVHQSSNSGIDFTEFDEAKEFMNTHKHNQSWHCSEEE